MTNYEKIKKELRYLYEAQKVLLKYGINTRSIDSQLFKLIKKLLKELKYVKKV